MFIMRLGLGNMLLFLALGPCFKSIDAQETTTKADENITATLSNKNTVEPTLSSDIARATTENTDILLHRETTLANEISSMPMEPTIESTPPPSDEIEQTSLETPETTPVQIQHTTVTTYTVPVIVETTATEPITQGAPSTIQYETTVGFTSPESSRPTERPTEDITTAADITTHSTEALSPTSILITPTVDQTESTYITSLLDPEDTSTETSTTTSSSILTTELPQNTPDDPQQESVSTYFPTIVTVVIIKESSMPSSNSWFLIVIVFVAVFFALCVGAILFVQRRKKNASRNFGPMYANGQSKRSKKKKGANDDTWAGPVKLEGLECDAEVQEGLLPNSGKQDGDDMVLSTFATLDEGDKSNGGVGGDGTKEAKKWEEQEPMLYIDEDVNEEKTGTILEKSEGQKGDEKRGVNGGETFCLTTAV